MIPKFETAKSVYEMRNMLFNSVVGKTKEEIESITKAYNDAYGSVYAKEVQATSGWMTSV